MLFPFLSYNWTPIQWSLLIRLATGADRISEYKPQRLTTSLCQLHQGLLPHQPLRYSHSLHILSIYPSNHVSKSTLVETEWKVKQHQQMRTCHTCLSSNTCTIQYNTTLACNSYSLCEGVQFLMGRDREVVWTLNKVYTEGGVIYNITNYDLSTEHCYTHTNNNSIHNLMLRY